MECKRSGDIQKRWVYRNYRALISLVVVRGWGRGIAGASYYSRGVEMRTHDTP